MKLLRPLKSIIGAGILLLSLQGIVNGQISQGGSPIQIQKLKSVSTDDLIVLPAFDNEQLREASQAEHKHSGLKPFHFAEPFDGSWTPVNSGQWYDAGMVKVWQLMFRSTGAYSLNVIFGRFNIPENARLFIVGAKNGDVKGAYTSENNSPSGVLAVEPVEGDEILIQYEEPAGVTFPGEIEISRISHDFMGINATDDHRPLGISGSCNVNVNCAVGNGTEEIKDAVCRILVEGTELCTGTLINNTAKDGTPYLLTAYHCINSEKKANSTVFLFNYEAPSCASIDGDISRSLSGSNLKAAFDSLDFALVKISKAIPYTDRPYFAGWDRRNQASSSSKSIHHPLGDIKKISIDNNSPVTGRYNNTYLANGCWKILRWDYGTTEIGSSGGPLFNNNNQLVGTLTGGAADCSLPTDDYFAKFALAWNYRKETSKQLKFWLDPANTNAETLDGYNPNIGTAFCQPVTNFRDNENYTLKRIPKATLQKQYYSGTNTSGFTEFAEQFKFSKSCEIQGISLGIAKAKTNPLYSTSMLQVKVYKGVNSPDTLLYSQKYDIKKFYPDAMNHLQFNTPVHTSGSFFVSFNIQELHPGDTLAVYMADRVNDPANSFFLKNATGWLTYNSQNTAGNGSAILAELIACNIDALTKIDSFDNENIAYFFPNPVGEAALLNVKTKDKIDDDEDALVYDLLGKEQNISVIPISPKELLLNFSGKAPGIYFVHFKAGGRNIVGKIAYIP